MEKKIQSFIALGFPEDLSKKIVYKGFTKSKLKNFTKKDLLQSFNEQETQEIREKISRKSIPQSVISKLIQDSDWKCCVCWDISKCQNVVIHHIIPYHKTQDNNYDNLIVLCLNHHGVAHTKSDLGQPPLPSEVLKKKKLEWTKYVTEYKILHRFKKTAIIHYSTKLALIEKSLIQSEFIHESFDYIEEIVTSTELLVDASHWEKERQNQEKILGLLKKNTSIPRDFYLFSIHRIPLVIHLGFLLGDGVKVTPFQYNRVTHTWQWDLKMDLGPGDQFSIDDTQINMGNKNENFIMLFEISSKIDTLDYLEHIPTCGGIFRITANVPGREWLKYRKQLDDFTSAYYHALSQIRRQNPFIKTFHLFYAGPTPLAFRIGQAINDTMMSRFVTYNFNEQSIPRYKKIFEFGKKIT